MNILGMLLFINGQSVNTHDQNNRNIIEIDHVEIDHKLYIHFKKCEF